MITSKQEFELDSLLYCMIDSYYIIQEENRHETEWGARHAIADWKVQTYQLLDDFNREEHDYLLSRLKQEDERLYLMIAAIVNSIYQDRELLLIEDYEEDEEEFEYESSSFFSKIKKTIENWFKKPKSKYSDLELDRIVEENLDKELDGEEMDFVGSICGWKDCDDI